MKEEDRPFRDQVATSSEETIRQRIVGFSQFNDKSLDDRRKSAITEANSMQKGYRTSGFIMENKSSSVDTQRM